MHNRWSMYTQVDPDMKAGLWMICKALKERNYLESYDIYMRLAVGVPLLLFCFQGSQGVRHD